MPIPLSPHPVLSIDGIARDSIGKCIFVIFNWGDMATDIKLIASVVDLKTGETIDTKEKTIPSIPKAREGFKPTVQSVTLQFDNVKENTDYMIVVLVSCKEGVQFEKSLNVKW